MKHKIINLKVSNFGTQKPKKSPQPKGTLVNYYLPNSILAIWFSNTKKSKFLKLSNKPKQNKINKIQ